MSFNTLQGNSRQVLRNKLLPPCNGDEFHSANLIGQTRVHGLPDGMRLKLNIDLKDDFAQKLANIMNVLEEHYGQGRGRQASQERFAAFHKTIVRDDASKVSLRLEETIDFSDGNMGPSNSKNYWYTVDSFLRLLAMIALDVKDDAQISSNTPRVLSQQIEELVSVDYYNHWPKVLDQNISSACVELIELISTQFVYHARKRPMARERLELTGSDKAAADVFKEKYKLLLIGELSYKEHNAICHVIKNMPSHEWLTTNNWRDVFMFWQLVYPPRFLTQSMKSCFLQEVQSKTAQISLF